MSRRPAMPRSMTDVRRIAGHAPVTFSTGAI
jgi:hypothetical protein